MEKQIEQFANDIFKSRVAIDGIDIAFAAIHGVKDSHFERIAKYLTEQGYVKQEQGEWKVRGLSRPRSCPITHAITCSKCGFDIEMLQGKRYRYCPNCGAKMKGAE